MARPYCVADPLKGPIWEMRRPMGFTFGIRLNRRNHVRERTELTNGPVVDGPLLLGGRSVKRAIWKTRRSVRFAFGIRRNSRNLDCDRSNRKMGRWSTSRTYWATDA